MKVLDKWYAERIKKAYTQKDVDEMIRITASILNEMKNVNPYLKANIVQEISERISVKRRIETSRHHFSRNYATFEAIKEGFEVCGERLEDLPEERQKKIENFLQIHEQMNNFVNNVREKSTKKFPNDLSVEDINEAFLKVFGGWQGFFDFNEKITVYIPKLFGYSVEEGTLTKQVDDFINKVLKTLKNVDKAFYKRAFGDLEKKFK